MKNAWQRLKEAWANLPRSTKLLLAALLLVGGVALWYVGLYLPAQVAEAPTPAPSTQVIEAQRGPLKLNNLLDSYLRPQYEQIRLNDSAPNLQPQQQPQPAQQQQVQSPAQPAFPFAALFDKPRLNESQPNASRDQPLM